MRKFLMAGAAAIAMAAMPTISSAQSEMDAAPDAVEGQQSTFEMNESQRAQYDSWPQERQQDYDSWSSENQDYYWNLDPQYQEGYWALTPDQRAQISRMSEEQQAAAWTSIMSQLQGTPDMATADPAMGAAPAGEMEAPPATASAGEMMESQDLASSSAADAAGSTAATTRFVDSETVQGNMTPTAQPEYPPCRGEVQDSCTNPGAASED